MAIDKSIITPAEASETVQAGFDFVKGILPFSNVFPMQSNDGLWTVTWTPNVQNEAVNPMRRRALDAEIGHVSHSTASREMHTGLLPLSGMDHITERDMSMHATDKTWLRNAAEEGFERLGRMAAVTLEIESINAFVSGKIGINENGIDNTYSFGRPTKQQSQSPAAKWNVATADITADIDGWNQTIRKNGGRVCRAAFTTSAVIDALRTNDLIRAYTYQTSAELAPPRVTREQVFAYLESNCGLTDVRMVDVMYEDLELDNGFKMNTDLSTLIPDKTFVMLPSFNDPTLGFTADGPTAEGADPAYELNKTVNRGMVGALLSHEAPANYDMWVNGSALPVLVDAVSTFEADVL